MENQMTFEKKVRSFTAKRLVNVMIKGLENEWVKVNMNTFGRFNFENGICYGCAATNAICEIMQKPFVIGEIERISSRATGINVNSDFLRDFEYAINNLRRGDVEGYNYFAKEIGMTLLPKSKKTKLPCLTTENYKENLKVYKEYASKLPRRKLK